MYYNQFLNSYVVLERSMTEVRESVSEFISIIEPHNQELFRLHSYCFNLDVLKQLIEIRPNDIGENLIPFGIVENLKIDSIQWLNICTIYYSMKKTTCELLKMLMIDILDFINDMHSYLNIGVHNSYIKRHILKG